MTSSEFQGINLAISTNGPMHPFKFTPFPNLRSDAACEAAFPDRDGFVDDAVVQALVAGPMNSRQAADPRSLVLAADDMDFAGWSLSTTLPPRSIQAAQSHPEVVTRRPAPPEITEPGIGEPHRGSHRWWLAGLAGAFSAVLFSVLLLSLSSRIPANPPEISSIEKQREPKTHITPKKEASTAIPELTDALPQR